MRRTVTPSVRDTARATLSRAREIEAYLPPTAPVSPAFFGPEIDALVTESLHPRQQEPPGFTRQPVPHGVPAPREAVVPQVPATAGLFGALNEKRRRDQELVEALQRRSRAARRFSGAPIIKNSSKAPR